MRAPTAKREPYNQEGGAGGETYLLIGGPEHGKLLAVPQRTTAIEYDELSEADAARAMLDADPPSSAALSWRRRTYDTRTLAAVDLDGSTWRIDVGVWDGLRACPDEQLLRHAMAAMIRYVPPARRLPPDRSRFRTAVLLDAWDEPVELVTVAPSSGGDAILLAPVTGSPHPRAKLIDTRPDAPRPTSPTWVIVDDEGRPRRRVEGPLL